MSEQREKGTVKWFNPTKGYGFIKRDNGDDVFLHITALRNQKGATPIDGQKVEYVLSNGAKGLQAQDVILE